MKTKPVLAIMITSLFLLYGCSNNQDSIAESGSIEESALVSKESASKSSVINQTYPQAQQEVLETFGAIGQSITLGAGEGYDSEYMDQLISFHAYGDKFVEFNHGSEFDSEENEDNERQLIGEDLVVGGVKKFDAKEGSLKVAVYYGNVANVTFTSDFELIHKEFGPITVNDRITLLFVKTKGKWKIVHEHHSPSADNEDSFEELGLASKASLSKSTFISKSSVTDQTYPQAQQEVLETFGAIGQSITLGAGEGYDSEYMDQLISFHAYGDKFVEFNHGSEFDSEENEDNERQLIGEDLVVGGVKKFDAKEGSLKVAVYYGNVANVTFTADFELIHKEFGPITVNDRITLLFVKTKGKWKIVHEHHSPSK